MSNLTCLDDGDKQWPVSYSKVKTETKFWNYDSLFAKVLSGKKKTIQFLTDRKVLCSSNVYCLSCDNIMNISNCLTSKYQEGSAYRCQKRETLSKFL
jgi:hypothetical protein